MAVAAPVADSSATLKMPDATPIADRVKAQLQRDYPPGALAWVSDLSWSGPARVPMDQIDRNAGDWSAADDKRKVNAFATRISAGWRKPVVAIRRPGQRLLLLIDGHTRAAASAQIGQPVTAWIGTAKTAHGGWESAHGRQLANGSPALEFGAAGYPAGVVGKRSGMISLDLPPGTVKPVPGGVTDFHVTVVFLGDEVDDQAFAKACARAKAAAASAGGPLTGTVRGVASFPPSDSSEGKRPAYAPVAIPGAQAIRSQLEDLSASEHGFSPHVTLSYVGKDDPLPPPVPPTPVKFTHLSVHRGGDVKSFPLGGGTSEHASQGEAIELVGPKGYIHGWIFVGTPAVGDHVLHPHHGHGTVTAAPGSHVSVRFGSGAEHSFPVNPAPGPGHFERMTDEQVIKHLGDGTGERFRLALAELDRRDQADRAEKVRQLYATVPRTAAEKDHVYAALVRGGENPEDAWAHAHGVSSARLQRKAVTAQMKAQGYGGGSFDAVSRSAFRAEAQRQAIAAEKATNGFMLNDAGRRAGIDPWSLMTGPESRARKYASDELRGYWDANGRPTIAAFQAQLLGHVASSTPAGGDFLK